MNHRLFGLVLGIALLTKPSFAQIDLTGDWAPRIHTDEQDRRGGPDIGDYSGLPVNDSARMLADTWNSSRLSLQEHQCMAHMVAYMSQAPFPFRISMERNPDTQELIAVKIYYQVYEQTQMIWMDGRPHPSPNAKHMNMGFSTGQWNRRRPDGNHHASSSGLAAKERDCAEFTRHAAGALDPPRRCSDARQHSYRSGLSHGAVYQDGQFRSGTASTRPLAVSV